MGAVIDRLRMPGQPLTAVHLGAGALTIPRYIEATRPGSRQQVVELEPPLVDLVRDAPAAAAEAPRSGSASAMRARSLAQLPAGLDRRGRPARLRRLRRSADPRAPDHASSSTGSRRLLAPDGVLLVNVADGAGLAFARRQVATVREVLEHVIVLAEVQVLKGRRFGNLVIAASASPLPTEWLPRLMAAGPHPAKVAQGAEIDEFIRGASTGDRR